MCPKDSLYRRMPISHIVIVPSSGDESNRICSKLQTAAASEGKEKSDSNGARGGGGGGALWMDNSG